MERLTEKDGRPGRKYNYKRNEDGYCFIGEQQIVDKLGEYEDLEEQGLFVRLPCRTYDDVYRICGKNIETEKVIGFYIHETEIYYDLGWAQFNMNSKDIFLTREEAERRLKELKEL